MSYTVQDLEKAIVKHLWGQEDPGYHTEDRKNDDPEMPESMDEELWSDVSEELQTWREESGEKIELPEIGTLTCVEDFGGEGMGDQYYMVFKVSNGEGDRFFRINGWYGSFDGGHLEGPFEEVKPVEYTATRYDSM